MANSFDSGVSKKVMQAAASSFETNRVITKNVNTQLFNGSFTPNNGDKIYVKRPTDYRADRTATGDVSAAAVNDIIVGSAYAQVQDYFTVRLEWDEVDEALKMGKLDQVLDPAMRRLATNLEVDFADFMRKNAGLLAGTYGTAATTWDHIAEAGAVLQSSGVPMDSMWNYAVNPFTQRKLASTQKSLGNGSDSLVDSAFKRAVITSNFAGMDIYTATALGTVTTDSAADRVGALAANPDVTYATHKDTMIQSLSVNAFGANLVVKAGEIIQVTGRNRLNMSTRKPMIDDTGAKVVFTGVVTEDVTLSGTGTGTIKIAGAAIYEANGSYNTVDSAPVSGDVVTLLGAASTTYQPNLFWHKNAFTLTSIPIKKLHSTDTVYTSEDGLQMRVSRYADGDKNKNIVRFDLHCAYGVLNPFFAGQGWGS